MVHAFAQRAGAFDGVVYDRRKLDTILAELDLAPADAAHVDQVVHQPHHLPDLTLHHLERRMDGLPIAARQPHDLQGVADRGQRVAKLMG
jgi:hypothetical protein